MNPAPPIQTPKGLFIAGTDTGVGKSVVTAALLQVCTALGIRALGMKPVAAGAEQVDGAWINEDVALLTQASPIKAPPELVNPYLFREAIAPHIAADRKGVRIEIPHIVDCFNALAPLADWVLVEGVGGFRVPLSPHTDTADLANALDLPILLVVGMRLGCINHALLTAEAIRSRNLPLAGWVANRIDPDMAVYAENVKSLTSRLDAPLLAEIPHQPGLASKEEVNLAARWIPPHAFSKWLSEINRSFTPLSH